MWEWDDANELNSKTLQILTKRLRLDSGTMTPLFRRMEKAGLVKGEVNIRDRRETLVKLTKKGRKLREDARQIPQTLTSRFAGNKVAIERYELLKLQLDELLNELAENHQAMPSS